MQWLREYSLIGVGPDSEGLDFSALRISFDIKKTTTPTPNDAKIRIYNLSLATAKQAKQEFKRFQLKAGYTGASDIIFDGNVKEARIGSLGTETYLDIIGGDGDKAYNFSVVNDTVSPGSTFQDMFDAACKPMFGNDVSLGYIDCFDPVVFPRGRVLYGMSRAFIEKLCRSTNKYWSIQDQKLQVIDHKKTLPGEAFVISEDTGMVGLPEEVNEGLKVRALLNPKLRVDAEVKIESKNISDIARSASGFYRILQINHTGDTTENDWFSDLICVAKDKTGDTTTDSEER